MSDGVRIIQLRDQYDYRDAQSAVSRAPEGWVVTIRPANRSVDQNALFHKLCGTIAKRFPKWNGINMDAEDWKALLIVSHAVATKTGSPYRMAPDLEGVGLVQLRESSAKMSKSRASSLIDYVQAWAAQHGVEVG